MQVALVVGLFVLLFGASSAHLAGNTTRLCLEQSSYFVHLHTVQTIAQGASEIFPNGTGAPAFILSSQWAQNSSSTRRSDVQIFFGLNSSLPGPFEVWNETSFFHDPNAALWAISSTQTNSSALIAVAITFNHSNIDDVPNKYLLWGQYNLSGTPPRLQGDVHRWRDPFPDEPIYNISLNQVVAAPVSPHIDEFCSRTDTPGIKLRRTATSVFALTRNSGSMKLIKYDAISMQPMWKQMLVPRVEPGGCALAAQTHHIAMISVDPANDDVWVVVTPYSPDATEGFVQLHNITLPEKVDPTKPVSFLIGFNSDGFRLHWEVVSERNGTCAPVPWVRGDVAIAEGRKRVSVVTSCLDQMDSGRHLDRGWVKVTTFTKNETHPRKLHVETQNKFVLLDLDADSVSLSSAVYHTKSVLLIAGEAGYRTDTNNQFTQGGDGFVSLFDSAAGGTMSMQRFYLGPRRLRRNSVTSIVRDGRNRASLLTKTYYITADLDGPLARDPVQTQKIALYELQIPTNVEPETPAKLWIVVGATAFVFVVLGCVGVVMYIRQKRQEAQYQRIQ